MKARIVHYSGRVQGVGFRATVAMIARNHPVTGWVKNLPDGRVQVHVEGESEDVDEFLEAVRSRFKRNIVQEQVEDEPPTGEFDGFDIAY